MELPDPLLPLPDAVIQVPNEGSAEERLAAVVEAVFDHLNLHAMAWPAKNSNGELVPPPDEHVLHELAHVHDLVDEERLFARPQLRTVSVQFDPLPSCDLCGSDARYDVSSVVEGRDHPALLCSVHYREKGSMTLGASGDTYLMRSVEVPARVREACNLLLEAQSRELLF